MAASKRSIKIRKTNAPLQANHEGLAAAKDAGLIYVSDNRPGITRVRSGSGFRYRTPLGEALKDEDELARIKALVIPPAWSDVWISPLKIGHLQATGRDVKGRKQYRYHSEWQKTRDATKFDRLFDLGKALPRLRRKIRHDLAQKGMTRNKVLATIVRLMEKTLIRVGNEEYAKQNHSFGLTTMRGRHVDVTGSRMRFEFQGKSGVWHEIDVRDPRLARIVKCCQELPGQALFQYRDDNNNLCLVDSSDVNDYLREATGQNFTSKDLRTWAGTVLAIDALQQMPPIGSRAEAQRNFVKAIQSTSRQLGNTKAVCRKCYVHPIVEEAYLQGILTAAVKGSEARKSESANLKRNERVLMRLLKQKRMPL